jgi:lipopolysaccharide transport system permease protein
MLTTTNLRNLIELTKSDFKLRYTNNLFGYFWSIVNPLLMLTTLYLIFSIVIKLNIEYYQIFLLVGILVWNFFVNATTSSMNSLISKADLIKKMKFPIWLIIISACLISLADLIISLLILVLMMFVFGLSFNTVMLLSFAYLFILFAFALGVSYMLSAVYLFFRDLVHIWNFITLIGFWLTPIIYSELQIPLVFRKYYMLNPLARIINHLRDSLLYNYYSFEQTFITLVVCVSVLLFGIFLFDRFSSNFAEEL